MKYINKNPEILIIDDSPEHIHLVAAIIKKRNYGVRAVTKSKLTFEALKMGIPDLILLDVVMPEIGGFELCSKLKNDPLYQAIPIIFLTAVNDCENIVRGFEAGAQDYVSKPVNCRELMARIDTHLKLKKRTDKLIEAYNDIESFNHMISHDLKAPIWSISKLTGFLREAVGTGNQEEINELLDIISEKTGETVKLIEKYAELAKLTGSPVDTSQVSMDSLAREAIEKIKKAYPQQEIVFHKSELPVVHGDKLLLEQVLINIFSNSVKYSQGRKVSIINLECKKNADEYLFWVQDNGVGFDMNYAENIFNSFVRLHSKTEFEGTGIGLSIVKKVINRHGGKVWITAEVDKGATVYFTLPVEIEVGNLSG